MKKMEVIWNFASNGDNGNIGGDIVGKIYLEWRKDETACIKIGDTCNILDMTIGWITFHQ